MLEGVIGRMKKIKKLYIVDNCMDSCSGYMGRFGCRYHDRVTCYSRGGVGVFSGVHNVRFVNTVYNKELLEGILI